MYWMVVYVVVVEVVGGVWFVLLVDWFEMFGWGVGLGIWLIVFSVLMLLDRVVWCVVWWGCYVGWLFVIWCYVYCKVFDCLFDDIGGFVVVFVGV